MMRLVAFSETRSILRTFGCNYEIICMYWPTDCTFGTDYVYAQLPTNLWSIRTFLLTAFCHIICPNTRLIRSNLHMSGVRYEEAYFLYTPIIQNLLRICSELFTHFGVLELSTNSTKTMNNFLHKIVQILHNFVNIYESFRSCGDQNGVRSCLRILFHFFFFLYIWFIVIFSSCCIFGSQLVSKYSALRI